MAWTDVPTLLAEYDAEKYAPRYASETLLAEYGARIPAEVPEWRREEFERALNYRLIACRNLNTSRGVRPK